MDKITYQQVLADMYEDTAKNVLVDETEYEEEQIPPRDTTRQEVPELENQEEFQKFHGSRQIVEVPKHIPIYKDYTTQSIRYNKDVQTRVISIDSRFRSNYGDSPTNFLFKLLTPVKNVISMRLSSIEIPNTYYNFSKVKGNIYMRVYFPSGQTTNYRDVMYDGAVFFDPTQNFYSLGIPDGNYVVDFASGSPSPLINEVSNIVTLLGYLLNTPNPPSMNPNDNLGTTNQFNVNVTPISSKFTISYSGGPFDIDFITNSPFSDRQYDWGLGYNLGFRQKAYFGQSAYTSEGIPDAIGPNYIFLSLDPDWKVITHNHPDKQQFAPFAKIVVNVPKNDVIYDNGSNTITKEYWLGQPTDIQTFNVQLVDPYEEAIDLVGSNMSITLELKEVMNPGVYEHIRDVLQPNQQHLFEEGT